MTIKLKHLAKPMEVTDIKIRNRVVIFYPKDVAHSECCDITDIESIDTPTTKLVSYDRTPVASVVTGKKK